MQKEYLQTDSERTEYVLVIKNLKTNRTTQRILPLTDERAKYWQDRIGENKDGYLLKDFYRWD